MLDYLKEYNISVKTIKDIKDKYYEELIDTLDNNEYEVRKILDYFKSIGIKDFNGLLSENLPIFLSEYNYIYNTFNKIPNLKNTVKKINEDYMYINEVIDY